MQEANVPVPLLRPDQSNPRYGGPVGRLRRLTNGIVHKDDDNDGRIRVEKRDGFHALSRVTSSVITPGPATTGIPGTTLLGTLNDELVQIGNSTPYVYAPSGPQYEKFDDRVMTETAKRHIVRASTLTIEQGDGARVGTVACWVYSEGGKCYVMFVDLLTDTPIRAPVQLATAGRIKVCADGVRFWVFYDSGGATLTVLAFGTDGNAQGGGLAVASTLPLQNGPAPWDIQAMPGTGNGAVVAHNAAIGVDYARLAFVTLPAGSIVVTGPVFDQKLPMTYGVCFLRNDFDPTHLYIATTVQFAYTSAPDPTRNPGVYVGRLNLDGTHDAMYVLDGTLTQAQVRGIAGLTGYLAALGGVVYVSWTSFEQSGGLPGRRMNSTVTTRFADTAVSAPVGVKRSVSLAGRAFKLGTRYVVPCYYASVSQEASAPPAAVPSAQPAYFLVDIATQSIVGEVEQDFASFDWQFTGWDPTLVFGTRFFWLPSPFADANGIVHWPAGYAVDVETVQIFDPGLGTTANKAVPIAGILDIRLGGRGIPIEFADELLLPGPRAVSFARDRFVSTGIELGAETPSVTGLVGTGPFSAGETHRYAIVYSVLDAAGNRTRSIASITTNPVQLSGGQNTFRVKIPMLRMTSHATVLVDVFRDTWNGTQSSNQLRKITVDQPNTGDPRVPIYNDPTVDLFTFDDTVTNAACAIGAPIYTDDGTLDFYPCPPHSTGCVFGDRVFVGGYSNRVYYSFSKVPGEALAFNQDAFFFTLPTNQHATAIVPLDNRLFVFTESRIFYVDGGNFLSADGLSGTNPTPIELTFQNGCAGRARAITEGILYHSSAGDIWLLTRGLDNIRVGAPVEDDMAGASVLDIAVDENQRIGVLTGANLLIYDQVHKLWATWILPTPGVALTSWEGSFVVADDQATQRTYVQVAGAFDDNGAPIQTRITLDDIDTADVNGFQVIWEVAAYGQWKGAHTFNVDCTYDGTDVIDETFSETFASLLDPFRFDWQPRNIECSSIGLVIYDTFPGNVPSQGFALESLGLYCGVERGKKYNETRIAPAG